MGKSNVRSHTEFSFLLFASTLAAFLILHLFRATDPLAFVLDVESEQYDIAILYNVILTFGADESFFFGCIVASLLYKIIIAYDLCTDKSSLKVRMNLTCCLRCLCSSLNGPCTALIRSCRQVADQT